MSLKTSITKIVRPTMGPKPGEKSMRLVKKQ
jgi:hypothetical protein